VKTDDSHHVNWRKHRLEMDILLTFLIPLLDDKLKNVTYPGIGASKECVMKTSFRFAYTYGHTSTHSRFNICRMA